MRSNHWYVIMKNGVVMNKLLVMIGLLILGKGIFDFWGALFGTTTFEEATSMNTYFEAGYYYFGFVVGLSIAYLGNTVVKIYTSIVCGSCLTITPYTILDNLGQTKWQAEECTSIPTLDDIDRCFKEHGLSNS